MVVWQTKFGPTVTKNELTWPHVRGSRETRCFSSEGCFGSSCVGEFSFLSIRSGGHNTVARYISSTCLVLSGILVQEEEDEAL